MQLRLSNSTKRTGAPTPLPGTNIERTADHTNPGTRNPAVKKTASKLLKVIDPFLSCLLSFSSRCFLHDGNLLVRQTVKLVNQPVDLPVRGVDLPLQYGLLVSRLCRGQLLVQ